MRLLQIFRTKVEVNKILRSLTLTSLDISLNVLLFLIFLDTLRALSSLQTIGFQPMLCQQVLFLTVLVILHGLYTGAGEGLCDFISQTRHLLSIIVVVFL